MPRFRTRRRTRASGTAKTDHDRQAGLYLAGRWLAGDPPSTLPRSASPSAAQGDEQRVRHHRMHGQRQTRRWRGSLRPETLEDSNLAHAVLVGANVCDANLNRANLTHADLRRMFGTRANLNEAQITRSAMYEVRLRSALLYRATSTAPSSTAPILRTHFWTRRLYGTRCSGCEPERRVYHSHRFRGRGSHRRTASRRAL
jgi:uncharacterized protein YjbI with pentapeptide repeats